MEVEQVIERMRLLAAQAVGREKSQEARAKLAAICEAPSTVTVSRVVQLVQLGAYEAADRLLAGLPQANPEQMLLAETLLDPEATERLEAVEIFTLGEALRLRPEQLAAHGLTHEQLMQLRMLGRKYVANWQRQQSQIGLPRRAS